MLVLFFILTVLLAAAILWFAGVAAVYAVCFLIVGFRLATGRTTLGELNEKAGKAKLIRKEKKKNPKPKRGMGGFLSLPSPLNDPWLWN